MKTPESRAGKDGSARSMATDGKATGRFTLFERSMRAVVVVVGDILSQQSSELALVEDDDVIEQLPAHASYPAFCDTVPHART